MLSLVNPVNLNARLITKNEVLIISVCKSRILYTDKMESFRDVLLG